MKLWTTLTVAAALAVGVYMAPASATIMSCTSPNHPTVGFQLGSATDVACHSGNDKNTIDDNFVLFGKTGWTNDGTLSFTDAPTAGESSTFGDGTWAIGTLPAGLSFGDVIVVLKQSNSFAAFLIDATSGTWGTEGPGKSINDLSHSSIYYRDSGDGGNNPPPTAVPEPGAAGILLFGLALLGMGVFWRRRWS